MTELTQIEKAAWALYQKHSIEEKMGNQKVDSWFNLGPCTQEYYKVWAEELLEKENGES